MTPKTRQLRSPTAAREGYEQALRSRWRALTLIITAKLEAVAFEEEFAVHMVLPGGETVGQWLVPQIAEYKSNEMPPMIPGVAPRPLALEGSR